MVWNTQQDGQKQPTHVQTDPMRRDTGGFRFVWFPGSISPLTLVISTLINSNIISQVCVTI